MITNARASQIATVLLPTVGNYLDRIGNIQDKDLREDCQKTLARAQKVSEKEVTEERKILTDSHLTAAGQEAAMIKMVQKAVSELGFLREERDKIVQQYEGKKAKLFAIPPAKDAAQDYRDQTEIRTRMWTMPEQERKYLFQQALDQNQVDIIRAIRLAPGGSLLALVDPKSIDKAIENRIEEMVKEPETEEAKYLAELMTVMDSLDTLWQWIESNLSNYGKEAHGIFPLPSGDAREENR